MVKRLLAALVAGTTAAALLAGCGEGDAPPAASPPSGTTTSPASASESPTPSPAAPPAPSATAAPSPSARPVAIPSAAKAHTKAGAEAFVRAYFAEVNRAWQEPTVGNLASYGQTSCKSCEANIQTAKDLVAKKHRYDGSAASLKNVTARLDTASQRYHVRVAAVQEKRNVVDAAGKVVSREPRIPTEVEAALVWTGTWRIATIRLVA